VTGAADSTREAPACDVLARLHGAAKGDLLRFLPLAMRLLAGRLAGKGTWEVMTPAAMKDFYIPVNREQGRFLYLTARALGARNVVEFGTSFGISTIYLACAVKDNGGGRVIGSEIEPSKQARALENLRDAGVADWAEVRLGDARATLADAPEGIDLVLLDGWKDLYLPILELLTPKLRRGAVVLADNIFTFRRSLRPYVEHVQSGEHGFASHTLRLGDGFEYSVYAPSPPA
jgi:predicted O-methyltransferase YrrM